MRKREGKQSGMSFVRISLFVGDVKWQARTLKTGTKDQDERERQMP
jgi:hypothetical protein